MPGRFPMRPSSLMPEASSTVGSQPIRCWDSRQWQSMTRSIVPLRNHLVRSAKPCKDFKCVVRKSACF